MPVENKYVVSNLANKRMGFNVGEGDGRIRIIFETLEIAAADDDGSIYRFAQIASSARIVSARLSCDAITGGTDYELGLYRLLSEGGAVVSKGLLMTGQTLATALRDANAYTAPNIDSINRPLWQLLGLASDPGIVYDLAFTADTAGTAAGTITILIQYQ